jgi:hypothetical protein
VVRRDEAGNAVHALVRLKPGRSRADRIASRWELDLAGFLNRTPRPALAALCETLDIDASGTAGALRQRLWAWGAAYERRAIGGPVDPRLQPAPELVRGRLVAHRAVPARAGGSLPAARAARWPPSTIWPRPIPPPRPAPRPAGEPSSLDELLDRADALVGVRLGRPGRDKGAYGQTIAALLGLPRSADPAPDWAGRVEVKTITVERGRGGRWRLRDGPAIAMRSVDAAVKVARVLWLVRASGEDVAGAPVLSWFYQELDDDLGAAFARSRHLRPKGGKGTSGRGWYLGRDFFEACGLFASLNGP